jgi:hypothetical protein
VIKLEIGQHRAHWFRAEDGEKAFNLLLGYWYFQDMRKKLNNLKFVCMFIHKYSSLHFINQCLQATNQSYHYVKGIELSSFK